MKVETPETFKVWLEKYKHTANYFMATQGDQHALFLLMRDAYIQRDVDLEMLREELAVNELNCKPQIS